MRHSLATRAQIVISVVFNISTIVSYLSERSHIKYLYFNSVESLAIIIGYFSIVS
jgi:hypothetical protein